MLRVRNEEEIIQSSILSIIDFVDEVVVIDNASCDTTEEKIQELHRMYPNKIRLVRYPFTVSTYGSEFQNTPEHSVHSVAYFYNWCLSKCRYTSIIKWDADMIVPEEYRERWRDIRNTAISFARCVVNLAGRLVIRDSEGVFRDSIHEAQEPRIFPNCPDVFFGKQNNFPTELLLFRGSSLSHAVRMSLLKRVSFWEKPVYYEIKDVNKDEFQHFNKAERMPSKQKIEYKYCEKVRQQPDLFPKVQADRFLSLIA